MTMSFSFGEALFFGFLYYLCYNEIGTIGPGGWTVSNPITLSVIIGLFYGDLPTSLSLGAAIGMMYFGSSYQVGANLPTDSALAAIIAIPLALKFGIPRDTALITAVPFGLLGAFLSNFRRAIMGMFNPISQKYVEEGKYNKLWFSAVLGPQLVIFACYCIPLTLLLYFFGGAAGQIAANLPPVVTNAFSVIAQLLPGIGLVMCVIFIGKKELLPYFILGFYATALGNVQTLFMTLIAVCVACIHVSLCGNKFENEDDDDDEVEETKALNVYGGEHAAFKNRADVIKFSWFVMFFHRMSQSIQYFYGTGYGFCLMPYLKRIYKDDEPKLKAAITRHLKPYITNESWGMWIVTCALAMEEDIAINGDPDGSKGEHIETFKTSLMGPMAGLGDTITNGVICPLVFSITYPLAGQGHVWAAFPCFFLLAVDAIFWIISGVVGYEKGKEGMSKLLGSPALTKVMYGASIVGIIMMGALCASYCSLNLAITWEGITGTVALNDVLNSLLPNFCTLAFLAICYVLMTKGVSFIKIMLGVVAIAFVLALLGIV